MLAKLLIATYTHSMATTKPTRPADDKRRPRRGRYRARTWLRGHLPYRLLWLAPKGLGDCGGHEWYRSDEATDRCYHCEAGVRAHQQLAVPRTELTEELERAAAGGSRAAADALATLRS